MRERFCRAAGLLLTASVIIGVPAFGQTPSDVARHYNVGEGQSLADALRQVSAQAGREILFSPGDVAGFIVPKLSGTFTVRQAIERLLANTQLDADLSEGAIIIRGRTQSPPAVAEHSSSVDPAIVVTGSRIRGATAPSPVITLSRRDIDNAGLGTIADALRTIPQNFGGGQNPGVAFGAGVKNAANANLTGASSLNLRGLGPDATLTLINGHRLAYDGTGQGVDIAGIPLPALDRIEIVADGASALYGSDAVAGVANIILRRDYDGVATVARLGTATEGGDFQQQYGLVAGRRWSTGGVIATYNFSRDTEIGSEQRDFTTSVLRPQFLLPAQKTHSAILSGHQALTDALTFSIDGLFSSRSMRTLTALPGLVGSSHNKSVSYSIIPTLTTKFGEWTIAATGNYGDNNTDAGLRYTSSATGLAVAASRSRYHNRIFGGEISGEGPTFRLPAGDLRIAVGGGYRKNQFILSARSPNSRSSGYAYGEASIPLISSAMGVPLINRIILTGAVRHERYNALGAITTPKTGLLYSPVSDIDLKASWGRSFKAPTFVQQYSDAGAYLYPVGSLGGVGYPVGSTGLLAYGGNPDLRPERATSWAAGAVFHPHHIKGLRLEASYFHVRYKDRVVQPVAYTAALSNPIYQPFLTPGPSAVQQQAIITRSADGLSNFTARPYNSAQTIVLIDDYYTNAAAQRIQGVDLALNYRRRVVGGDLVLDGQASWITSEQQSIPSAAFVALAGTVFNPPKLRLRAGISFDRGGAGGSLFVNRAGGVTDDRTTVLAPGEAMTTLDAALRVQVSPPFAQLKSIELSLAAQNLTNASPPFLRSTAAYYVAYDSTNFSAVGRQISLTGVAKW